MKTEATISGVTIPEGATVEVRFGAANLDPRHLEGYTPFGLRTLWMKFDRLG